MATVENFLLKFKVEGQSAINGATASVKNLGTEVSGLGGRLSGLVGGLGGVATGVGLVGGAFAALGMKAIALADQISDISDATGISAGALLNFKQSLIEAGGKAEDFSTLAAKLNQNIGDAATGSDKAQKAFRNLGVYITDAGGNVRSTEVILQDAIARLGGIEDPAKRAAMAVDLFGKSANKLDFTKLNAIRDPIADADIKRLADYQTAIDKIRNSLETKVISFFGQLALDIDKAGQKMAALEEEANKRGNTRRPMLGATGPAAGVVNPFGIGQPAGERALTAREKEALRIREMERLNAPAMGKPRGRTQEAIDAAAAAGKGGFGATPEATLKAVAESEKRLRQSNIDANKNIALKSANDIQAIEINAAAEVAKARETIYNEERLSDAQKGAEFAAKKKEIESKASGDIAKTRSQLNAKIFSEEEAQRQASADAIAAQQKQFESAANTARDRADAFQQIREDLQDQIMLEETLRNMGATQANTQREIAAEIKKRTDAIKELGNIENLTYEDRLKQEERIRADSAINIELIKKRGADEVTRQQNFMSGWEDAWSAYKDNAMKYSEQAKSSFDNALTGLEDAFVRAVQTGKLSFKDLANSIIADLARIAFKRAVVSIGSAIFGIPGLATGGPVAANSPYIVGEKGPELFVPKSAGDIIPNNALTSGGGTGVTGSTTVNYNIQAVDASSFRSLVARDPSFIYAVTEQGRRSQPTRSR